MFVNDTIEARYAATSRTMTNKEVLVSVLSVGSTTAKAEAQVAALLSRFKNLRGLAAASMTEINAVLKNPKRSAAVAAVFELGRRVEIEAVQERPKITDSMVAAKVFTPHINHLAHEEMWVAVCNRMNEVIDVFCLSVGGTSSTIVDPKSLFKKLLLAGANSFVLAHNHPSGSRKPSMADLKITRELMAGAKALDIDFLDHLIIAHDNGYYSLKDEGDM